MRGCEMFTSSVFCKAFREYDGVHVYGIPGASSPSELNEVMVGRILDGERTSIGYFTTFLRCF